MAKKATKPSPVVETGPFELSNHYGSVRVSRPKNAITTVTGVDDIDVRDGSLLLLKREKSGAETCLMVFSPDQWIAVNVEPV
jgi:hypothetical protein